MHHHFWPPHKIISGGQTGVDRAALDVAIELRIPHGGWCPKGRLAEDGPIPDRYQLAEHPLPLYDERTRANVKDADATLILCLGPPIGGTKLTQDEARRQGKPYLVVQLSDPPDYDAIRRWARTNNAHVLNIAGPRESQSAGIGEKATAFLRHLFSTGE